LVIPASIWCFKPATRISKNSSRFELEIVRKRSRSSSGVEGSRACSRTRKLNSRSDSSRLRNGLDVVVAVSAIGSESVRNAFSGMGGL
jgi:hypothetical protein